MVDISLGHIWSTYRFLKTYAYHENLNLFIKARLAQFEEEFISGPVNMTLDAEKVFEAPISSFDETPMETFGRLLEADASSGNPFNLLIDVLNSDQPLSHEAFIGWLNDLDFKFIPKDVQIGSDDTDNSSSSTRPLFLSNKKTDDIYRVEKVNYFIDAPIEIHIIEIMWTLLVGSRLDRTMTKDCYGNRINDFAFKYAKDFYENGQVDHLQGEVFKRYIEQYNCWRDQAIKTARECADNDANTAIFSLDLKGYFYNIDIDFEEVANELDELVHDEEKKHFEITLNAMLQAIYARYHEKISEYLKFTHIDLDGQLGLPIGFASSSGSVRSSV